MSAEIMQGDKVKIDLKSYMPSYYITHTHDQRTIPIPEQLEDLDRVIAKIENMYSTETDKILYAIFYKTCQVLRSKRDDLSGWLTYQETESIEVIKVGK